MRVIIPTVPVAADRGSRIVDRESRIADRGSRIELLGLAAATIVVLSGVALTCVGQSQPLSSCAPALALLVLPFWGAHLFRRRQRGGDDPVLLPTLLTLTGIGLMSMMALRDPSRGNPIALPFAQGTAAGVVLLVLCSSIDLEASPLRRAVVLPFAAALALAMLLLLFGSGPGSSGVKVNLLGVQPVEAIRLLVILALAGYFARRLEFLRELSHAGPASPAWLRRARLPRWRDVSPVLVTMALVLLFFFLQKDLGPALVLSFVFLGLYGIARGRAAGVALGVAMLFAAFLAAHQIGYPATVRQRVAIWMDPWSNGVRGGDQIAHALWALASGAVTGSGPGLGDPQVIPAGHTDFVLAAVGEELGWIGVLAVIALNGVLCWRCLRVALRAPGDYTAFVSTGVSLGLAAQAMVIAGGLIGLLPLAGVVTPFLSYGRSSMVANFAAVGVVLAVARRAGPVREHFVAPVRALGGVLVAVALVVAARTGWIQVIRADRILAAPSLVEQADGGVRFQYNPRLLAVARLIERGTIHDRHGLTLATSRADEKVAAAEQYVAAGIQPPQPCDADSPRCYPLGGAAFHIVGDANYQTNWAARNSSFVERDEDARLRGFDDRARVVEVKSPRTGRTERTIRRDYSDLVPLFRNRHHPDAPAAQALLTKNRDVSSSIDARLQLRAAAAVESGIRAGGFTRGAAIVLDVASGEVLAAVSYPWPEAGDLSHRDVPAGGSALADRLLDRPRYGLYPPGSTFKMLMAAVALRTADERNETYSCIRLPDGRVGNYVKGFTRPIRDDPMDTVPHGSVDLHRGLVVSCNAYFAQLAARIGPQPLIDAASMFQIEVAQPSTAVALRRALPQAGYGQGQVTVSPVKMARIAAAIARDGRVAQACWTVEGAAPGAAEPRLLSTADAALLGRYMRDVVTSGTGRVLNGNPTPIAGKTGTAEVDNGRAHSWFAGFAPYGGASQPRIAFAVIVENAGYGARSAAPIAGQIVTAARELGVIR